MVRIEDLPFLVALLDDESEVVKEQVVSSLRSFGLELEKELDSVWNKVPTSQVNWLRNFCHQIRLEEFEAQWMDWLNYPDFYQGLERALMQLTLLEYGEGVLNIGQQCGHLATTFLRQNHPWTAEAFMRYFFVERKFSTPMHNYFYPSQVHVAEILSERGGDALGLCCIASIVARKAGLEIRPVVLPGHFLLGHLEAGELSLYNPMHKGKPMSDHAVQYFIDTQWNGDVNAREVFLPPSEIILQMLQHLIEAYCRKPSPEKAQIYANLYERLSKRIPHRNVF